MPESTEKENFNSHGQPLDGTGNIKPTPFDAHEQAVRGTHVETTENSPDKNPKTVQEFPKAVDHVQKPDAPAGHLEPVIAKDADHEDALAEAKADAEEESA